MEYLKRFADDELAMQLETMGAVLIEGPKWCGKTTTAEQQAHSILRMQDPDTRDALQQTALINPSFLLDGDTPRLIDEWQDAPVLWDAVRLAVDKRQEPGQFILTGSNAVKTDEIYHSGTGRIARLKMLPMSLFESKESNGSISLRELFDNPELDIDGKKSPLSIADLIFAACRGGWPAALKLTSERAKLLVAKNYFTSLCDFDLSSVDGVKRVPTLGRLIMQEYARNISTIAKKTNMLANIKQHTESLATSTYDDYLSAFERLFVISDVDAWSPAIRSATAVKSSPKREFVDPSIAVAALGLSPQKLSLDLKTFGFIFECMGIRDLRTYSQPYGGRVSYYRDRYGLEADAVLHLEDGRFALIEFKLGSREIDEGAEHLLELKRLIKEHNEKEKQVPLREPDLLIIVTGGQMAYTRPDSVKVIPLGCLTA